MNSKTIYSVSVWREDWWDFLGGQDMIHTEGTFRVDYGVNVCGITTENSYVETAGGCDKCEYNIEKSGVGSYVGEVTGHAIWATIQIPTIKCSQDTSVSCDRYCNEDGNGHGDKWGAVGCGCLAVP